MTMDCVICRECDDPNWPVKCSLHDGRMAHRECAEEAGLSQCHDCERWFPANDLRRGYEGAIFYDEDLCASCAGEAADEAKAMDELYRSLDERWNR